jgi:DNA end-binding protein Ku
MARAVWTGSITFGLVNVPVKLYTATEEKDVRFHQFQRQSKRRVHNKRVAEGGESEVPYEDIVKGYEVNKGEFVIVTPEELEAVAPGRTRTIDIEDFVDLSDIDPIYFARAYYLGPADDAAVRTYRLLVEAMGDTGKAGIGRFVLRSKEYLAAVRPSNGILVLETLFSPTRSATPRLSSARCRGRRSVSASSRSPVSSSSRWRPTGIRSATPTPTGSGSSTSSSARRRARRSSPSSPRHGRRSWI